MNVTGNRVVATCLARQSGVATSLFAALQRKISRCDKPCVAMIAAATHIDFGG